MSDLHGKYDNINVNRYKSDTYKLMSRVTGKHAHVHIYTVVSSFAESEGTINTEPDMTDPDYNCPADEIDGEIVRLIQGCDYRTKVAIIGFIDGAMTGRWKKHQ